MSRYKAARGCDTATVHHDTTLGAVIRAAQHTCAHSDTAEGGLRHNRCWATIRRHCAPRYGAMRAACAHKLGSRCAPGAPNPVLTQCTVPSHYLGHCS